MSQSQNKPIKTISISPELFTIGSQKRDKNKTLKKPQPNPNIKPNQLKHQLLTKIKNYKHNKKHKENKEIAENKEKVSTIAITKNITPSTNINETSHDIDKEFTDSLNFLRDLSLKNKKKQHNKPILVKTSFETNENPHEKTYEKTYEKTDEKTNEKTNEKTDEKMDKSNTLYKPQYGCLKNGNMPTYREWKNTTLKKSDDLKLKSEQNIVSNTLAKTQQEKSHHPKATTLKYYLGKRGKKVSVLIKNSDTRKKISKEHILLKQTKLADMKSYLKRHNLLKSGSNSPPDVIKKMYEQTLLGGDIRNSNKDNLIHNYLTE